MTTCRACPGRITMPGLLADSGIPFGSEVFAAYMRIGLSNSCTSRPALYRERVSGADARTRTRSGVNRKSAALLACDGSMQTVSLTAEARGRGQRSYRSSAGLNGIEWNSHADDNSTSPHLFTWLSQSSIDRQQGVGMRYPRFHRHRVTIL